MVISLVLVVRSWLVPVAPPAAATASVTVAQPQPRRRTSARSRGPKPGQLPVPSADPRLLLDLLKASEQVTYTGTGRNIFRAEAEPIVQPVTSPLQSKNAPPMAATPSTPPPPPINLRFFGFANRPGEAKRVFLAEGENVFIAAEGDIVARRYKVLHIGVNSVDIQDVLNNITQTIPLSQT